MSVSSLTEDRSTLYAYFAANYRIGMLGADKSRWWKQFLLSKAVEFDSISTHTVLMDLRLAEVLRLDPCSEIVIAWQEKDAHKVKQLVDINKKLAILHLRPKFSYKEWTKKAWISLAAWLLRIYYTVVLTGDKAESEKNLAAELLAILPEGIINLVGYLNLNQLGFRLGH